MNPTVIPAGCHRTGCGTQRPLRAKFCTCVLLAAAPTTPPCFRHWRRSSLLPTRGGLGKTIRLYAMPRAPLLGGLSPQVTEGFFRQNNQNFFFFFSRPKQHLLAIRCAVRYNGYNNVFSHEMDPRNDFLGGALWNTTIPSSAASPTARNLSPAARSCSV